MAETELDRKTYSMSILIHLIAHHILSSGSACANAGVRVLRNACRLDASADLHTAMMFHVLSSKRPFYSWYAILIISSC